MQETQYKFLLRYRKSYLLGKNTGKPFFKYIIDTLLTGSLKIHYRLFNMKEHTDLFYMISPNFRL